MKKSFVFLPICAMLLIFALAGCSSGSVSDDTSTIDPDIDNSIGLPFEDPESEPLDVHAYLNATGFVSAEAAYATTRETWHELLGEPAIAAVTYDGLYVAECYLYIEPDESWGQFLEFDYDIELVGGELEKDIGDSVSADSNSDDSDNLMSEAGQAGMSLLGVDMKALRATPEQIRYVVFDANDGEKAIASLDFDSIINASTLTLNKHLFLKSIDVLIERFGEPNNSELVPWGYASWDSDPTRFIVYLDGDMNVLYGHRVPLWDEIDDGDVADIEP